MNKTFLTSLLAVTAISAIAIAASFNSDSSGSRDLAISSTPGSHALTCGGGMCSKQTACGDDCRKQCCVKSDESKCGSGCQDKESKTCGGTCTKGDSDKEGDASE